MLLYQQIHTKQGALKAPCFILSATKAAISPTNLDTLFYIAPSSQWRPSCMCQPKQKILPMFHWEKGPEKWYPSGKKPHFP